MNKVYFLLFSLVVICTLAIVAASRFHSPLPSSVKPKVGVTIYALYDITHSIAGDKMETVLLLPPGASPHTYEPDPTLLQKLAGAKTVFRIGYGIDDWVMPIVQSQHIETMRVDNNVNLIIEQGTTDPHYFLSLRNMPIIARNILNRLILLDPANKDYYESRYQMYTRKAIDADSRLKLQMATSINTNVVTLHDAWKYLSRDYNLHIVGSFEPEGKEIKPQELATLNEAIKNNNIKVVFSEPSLSSSVLENYARDNKLVIKKINPLESIGDYNSSYISILESNIQTIYNALKTP